MVSIRNLTALEKLNLEVSIKAPPFLRISSASGTIKVLKPCLIRTFESVVTAVVLPEHGPPVIHILNIGYFDSARILE